MMHGECPRRHIGGLVHRSISRRVPTKFAVTWKLKEGDFYWLNMEVTDLRLNQLPYDSGKTAR